MVNLVRFLADHGLRLPHWRSSRHLLYGLVLGVSIPLATRSIAMYHRRRRRERIAAQTEFETRPIELRSEEILSGVAGLIGNTPLIRINSLSDALGVEILGKAEFLNVGGSVKDRVALRMIDDAERLGLLHPHTGSRIFEGTVGSTGISIATVARARGYDATIIMPDDVAEEKVKALLALGAEVERVRPASIVDTKHNLARHRAAHFGDSASQSGDSSPKPHLISSMSTSVVVSTTSDTKASEQNPEANEDFVVKPRGYFADQFENHSNYQAHYDGTGPEIWRQTNGNLDAFVSGAGTGGTIAGVGRYIKSKNPEVKLVLADPNGSGLYNKIKYGVMYDKKESEGTKRRHQVDTVVEGIGINRLTKNLELALPIIDDAFRVSDAEAVSMARYLVKHDGLFLGSSSACNLVAAVRLAKQEGWTGVRGIGGRRIVTILCDSGTRHYSKFWNDDYLDRAGLPHDASLIEEMLES
ncbi:tryptophan synthase beta subunit-like PLP-dependent enzyme [Schizophyllum amplum]|uniref:cysteine synthase n=1 Tax=Schizophyllum amplum TaxID=97359 RepID=A0A550CZQ4_9AGAR|nr:tryptophan synthase beta subunit-like PLP-dependent enzyme [Auriculariopsis ampla]